jgi:hypothetical protein
MWGRRARTRGRRRRSGRRRFDPARRRGNVGAEAAGSSGWTAASFGRDGDREREGERARVGAARVCGEREATWGGLIGVGDGADGRQRDERCGVSARARQRREVGDELAGGLGLHCALEAQRASELPPLFFFFYDFF